MMPATCVCARMYRAQSVVDRLKRQQSVKRIAPESSRPYSNISKRVKKYKICPPDIPGEYRKARETES